MEQEEKDEQFVQSSQGSFICSRCGYYTSEHKVVEGMTLCPSG